MTRNLVASLRLTVVAAACRLSLCQPQAPLGPGGGPMPQSWPTKRPMPRSRQTKRCRRPCECRRLGKELGVSGQRMGCLAKSEKVGEECILWGKV